jgi:hypothetical protein
VVKEDDGKERVYRIAYGYRVIGHLKTGQCGSSENQPLVRKISSLQLSTLQGSSLTFCKQKMPKRDERGENTKET